MRTMTDDQLLEAWAARRSDPAFSELVRRYVDVVYSAALRQVGNPPLAVDAEQDRSSALRICVHLCPSVVLLCPGTASTRRIGFRNAAACGNRHLFGRFPSLYWRAGRRRTGAMKNKMSSFAFGGD